MFASAADFPWQRPSKGGFDWGPVSNGDFRLSQTPDSVFVTYAPLREPLALYHQLAVTDLSPEGTLGFANRYGCLGEGAFGALPPIEQDVCGSKQTMVYTVEIFSRWVETIAYLREALRVWTLYREEKSEALAKIFCWERGYVDYVGSPQLLESLAADPRPNKQGYSLDQLRQLEPHCDILRTLRGGHCPPGLADDVLRPAITWVIDIINRILPRFNGPCLGWDATTNTVIYCDTPFSLFGAIWLQFAQAVHSSKTPKRCRTCGGWFEVAGGRKSGSKRTDREFCSNSCRTKNYLQRQEEARQRHQRGETPAKIAKELGTTATIVKNWLKNRKEK
jgi:hypothetical protein